MTKTARDNLIAARNILTGHIDIPMPDKPPYIESERVLDKPQECSRIHECDCFERMGVGSDSVTRSALHAEPPKTR